VYLESLFPSSLSLLPSLQSPSIRSKMELKPIQRPKMQNNNIGETPTASPSQTTSKSSQGTSIQHHIIIPQTTLNTIAPKRATRPDVCLSLQSADLNPGISPLSPCFHQIPHGSNLPNKEEWFWRRRYPQCVWKEDRELDIREDLPPPMLEPLEVDDDIDCWFDEWDY
jgi:hypothetical protein